MLLKAPMLGRIWREASAERARERDTIVVLKDFAGLFFCRLRLLSSPQQTGTQKSDSGDGYSSAASVGPKKRAMLPMHRTTDEANGA